MPVPTSADPATGKSQKRQGKIAENTYVAVCNMVSVLRLLSTSLISIQHKMPRLSAAPSATAVQTPHASHDSGARTWRSFENPVRDCAVTTPE